LLAFRKVHLHNSKLSRYDRAHGEALRPVLPVAHSLDVVGDRWALLVVRELMQGRSATPTLPRACPESGRTSLRARLRGLETAGVIAKKTLPPPAASRVYELTDTGSS